MQPEQVPPGTVTPLTLGAILAGGLARRLGGGDKGLRMLGGRTILSRIKERMIPQVVRLALNANEDAQRFASLALPVVGDTLQDHPGPLAGVLAVLEWTALNEPTIDWVVTVPGDAPFVSLDLVARLHAERRRLGAALACAASGGRSHPVIGLWPVAVRDDLRRAVAGQGIRKIDAFTGRYAVAVATWPSQPVDPFFNINTPGDLAEADRLCRSEPVEAATGLPGRPANGTSATLPNDTGLPA